MNLSIAVDSYSLLVVCIRLYSLAAQFGIERRAVLTGDFPLLSLPPLLFFFYPLTLLPKSLFTSSSLPPTLPALPQHLSLPQMLQPPPTVHAHTPLFPPLLISYPRVRYQSGEGLAEGVMKGWSWEPGRVRSAPSPRGERDRDNTYLPHMTCQSEPLPSPCMHAFAWATPIKMHKEIHMGKKADKRRLHTDTTLPPSENSYKHWNKLFVPELTAQAIDRHVQSHALTSHRSI